MGNCIGGASGASSTPVFQRSNSLEDLQKASTQLTQARSQARKPTLPGLKKLNGNTAALLDQADARIKMKLSGGSTEGTEHETQMSNQQLVQQMGLMAERWRSA
ncbi:hypothetical protein ACNRBS_19760 [Ralstonia pseudosolanacearum]|uniref:hypothetical protein n=1 Tax=Ralstonia pseudosolanacearum TaxID=1310165 RepID=UPI0018A65E23|nr:hypothetical protein [Ralstonia pseudosolanacearum]BCL90309.1 hypothetical protein MAFF211479_00100 [Ralstonia solanacearum]BCL90615.1 hypothetical protein MAFF211479_03160 [Ralstonia solanacearum]BCL92002.1 hypothetical protein MAFF211479_17030 [Ralstonia solanacearum]BCL93103.1 hypothetical protein MAFF211479_28040 [Ralstonia solanacearum]BCL93184.1 hypothetical protein MAFF211479_28850 [Ralstonia solanacearum]